MDIGFVYCIQASEYRYRTRDWSRGKKYRATQTQRRHTLIYFDNIIWGARQT